VGDHSTNNLDDGYLGSGRPYFQRALNKYGKQNFKKEILEFFDTKQEAFDAQEKWINVYKSLIPNGYNISPKGGHFSKGSMSESTKKKIGNANKISLRGKKQPKDLVEKRASKMRGIPSKLKGVKQSPESILKRSNSNRGKKRSEEIKEKMKEAQKNRKAISDETRLKMSMAKKNIKLSLEHKNKISKSLKGKPAHNKGISHSNETKRKISESNKGKIVSEETRKKMSISAKGRKKSPEHAAKCAAAHLGKKMPRTVCEFCNKEIAINMYVRFHGNNCKKRNI
jgi:hypothetical protein